MVGDSRRSIRETVHGRFAKLVRARYANFVQADFRRERRIAAAVREVAS